MPDNNKTQEFLQKLAPCIERSDLDACVEEAAKVAQEMGAEFSHADLPDFPDKTVLFICEKQ